MARVALISGFGSLRRFNAAFANHYRINPTQLRREGTPRSDTGLIVRLSYRPPLDAAALLGFFARRAVVGVESVDVDTKGHQTLSRTVQLNGEGRTHVGWLQAAFDVDHCAVRLRVSDSLAEALPQIIARARALLDLDADPATINACLRHPVSDTCRNAVPLLDPKWDGLRVPGCVDGFELAVRAILGQQITVAAACTLTNRLVQRFGAPVDTPFAGLDRLFPTAQTLASATPDALGQLGIVRQRQQAIIALARAVAAGELSLQASADFARTQVALTALPGIGHWTAQYVAMRALRDPDAFPAGDVALHKAMGVADAKAAERLSQAWRPWRSYAVLRLWQQGPVRSPATPPASPAPDQLGHSEYSDIHSLKRPFDDGLMPK